MTDDDRSPVDATQERSDTPVSVWLLCAVLAVAGVALTAFVVADFDGLDAPRSLPFWLLVPLFIVGEQAGVNLWLRRQTERVTFPEVPLILGVIFTGPLPTVLGYFVAGTIVAAARSPRGVKLVFNSLLSLFEGAVAVIVYYEVLGDASPLGVRGWVAAAALAIAGTFVSALLVGTAIALVQRPQGGLLWERWSLIMQTTSGVANAGIGLLAVTVIWHEPALSWVAGVVAVMMYGAYRAYIATRRRHDELERLYELTRPVVPDSTASVVHTVLERACGLLATERGGMVLFDGDGVQAWERIEEPAGSVHRVAAGPSGPALDACRTAVETGRSRIVERGERTSELRGMLFETAVTDAMLAPVKSGDVVLGCLYVGERTSTFESFTRQDLSLLETLAGYAGTTLANAGLVERLRWDALHDALTGLPNRASFHQAVQAGLDQAGDRLAAVILLDIDRFKEVNDTLGHHAGDQFVRVLGSRLIAVVASAPVARISGGEFAVFLPAVDGVDRAITTAEQILGALRQPLELDGIPIDVTLSAGVAIAPYHGTDAGTLLRRADVAINLAKRQHTPVELYDAPRDPYSPARLLLISQLRKALVSDELVLDYQPKVDLVSGAPVGAEALVRWQHPTRGLLSPDRFIPLAEHTGLIGPLTVWVLESAVEQASSWASWGLDLHVAVNLSARTLLDARLPERIRMLVDSHGVRPGLLVLEITESALIVDPRRTGELLRELSAMGLRISIDDFGTGYSSLSSLRELPIDEVKIDRSFVRHMDIDLNDTTIVRSMVDLGHNLGLQVVAEGVESVAVRRMLEDMGCDAAQGHLFSPPVGRDALERWILGQPSGRDPGRDPSMHQD